jgi:hypothetical protein
MNWKGYGRKRPWLNFKILVWNLPGRTEENTKNVNQDIRSSERELNPGPPECEGVFTRPRRSVFNVV